MNQYSNFRKFAAVGVGIDTNSSLFRRRLFVQGARRALQQLACLPYTSFHPFSLALNGYVAL